MGRLEDMRVIIDLSKLPTDALSDVAKRGHTYAEIERMTPEMFFDEYCRWHGLIGWGDTLLRIADAIRSATRKE